MQVYSLMVQFYLFFLAVIHRYFSIVFLTLMCHFVGASQEHLKVALSFAIVSFVSLDRTSVECHPDFQHRSCCYKPNSVTRQSFARFTFTSPTDAVALCWMFTIVICGRSPSAAYAVMLVLWTAGAVLQGWHPHSPLFTVLGSVTHSRPLHALSSCSI